MSRLHPDRGGLTAHLSRGRETTIPASACAAKPSLPIIWKVILPAAWVVLCLALNSGGARVQAADDHGDSFSTATNLPLGSSVAGRIDPGDDRDVFRLDLSSRSGSTDVWIYTTGDLDTVGYLYDSGDNLIAANGNGLIGNSWTNFHLRWVLPRGVYYVAVRSSPDRETDIRPTGSYRLHAQVATDPGSATGTAMRLDVGTLAPGTIDTARDSDYFRVDLSGTKNLIIYAVNLFLYYEVDDENLDLLPVEPLAVEVLDSRGAAVPVNVKERLITIDGERHPYGFLIRDDFGPGTYYFKVTTPADVTSHPVPYTIHAFEDTEYTEFIEDCEARTRSLNNPQINDPLYSCQWHLNSAEGVDINVEAAWAQGVTGEGVNVAVVDDGMYYTHEDLRDNVDTSRNHDYTGGGDIYHPYGHHGTHVAGIIAARDNGIGVRGVAPRATVYGYNYLVETTVSNQADAMARNRGTTAVSNNSWWRRDGPGLARVSSFWEQAVKAGLASGYDGKGVLYVFIAGNGHLEGGDSNLYEVANYYGVTSVCAVNDHDTRSIYSEMGTNLWVCAPSDDRGEDYKGIVTTENSDRYYEEFGGTSAAAPIVAGVAALMRSANPDLTWRDLKLILAATARKNDAGNTGWDDGARKYGSPSATDSYHFNREYGFGVVDAGAAVDLAQRWITAPPLRDSSVSSGSITRSIPAPGGRSPATVTERLTMNTSITFTEFVEINANFTHTSFRDMDIEMESPSGAVSKLTVPYNTRHLTDDEGGTLYIQLNGEFRFGSARHLGEDPNGEWKLRLTDTIAPYGGTLRSWSIKVYGHSGTPTIPAPTTPTPTPTPAPGVTPTPTPAPMLSRACDTGSAVTDKSNTGLVADCNALLTAKDKLRGTAALNWAPDTSIAQWDGVRLGGTPERVTIVRLQKKGLDGQIPAELGSLDMLGELWLYVNELSGSIPPEIGNLTNLRMLFVSNNRLSGQIPETLNNLSLDRLWLHNNDSTGCVPYNLTLTREYKVDRGLPACAPPGTGPAPTATPTPAPPGATPTPTPTLMPPTSDDVVRRIHCQSADFVAAFGEAYNLDDDATAFYYYDRNGRGLWERLTTRWVSSSDPRRVVVCRTTVYDNISSAAFDNQYATLVEEASGAYDVLRQHKRCCEEIGQVFRGLLLSLGSAADVGANRVVWTETQVRLAAVSSFRWNQVIVQVAAYDDTSVYIHSADEMARRVESRFDESIFDEIDTRQRASRGETRADGSVPSEDSLYLEPIIAKP